MLATPQQLQYCHVTNYPVHLKFHKFKGCRTNSASDYHGFATHRGGWGHQEVLPQLENQLTMV
jgi:hypothetical protein